MTNEDYQKIFHEIKNNVTLLSSSLQLLEKLHPEVKEYAYWNDAMQEACDLKHLLIELSSARLSDDLSLTKVSPEAFFPKLIHSCTDSFDSDAFECELTLVPPFRELSVDPDRLKRALFNLIKNSYEAMEGRGTVKIKGFAENNFFRLDLADCGGGILPEYLPKLFTPFETTNEQGTGLGLLIAKQLIEAHGGRLTVDSRPKDGCTFSVYLPFT